jgi:hypothetical protein
LPPPPPPPPPPGPSPRTDAHARSPTTPSPSSSSSTSAIGVTPNGAKNCSTRSCGTAPRPPLLGVATASATASSSSMSGSSAPVSAMLGLRSRASARRCRSRFTRRYTHTLVAVQAVGSTRGSSCCTKVSSPPQRAARSAGERPESLPVMPGRPAFHFEGSSSCRHFFCFASLPCCFSSAFCTTFIWPTSASTFVKSLMAIASVICLFRPSSCPSSCRCCDAPGSPPPPPPPASSPPPAPPPPPPPDALRSMGRANFPPSSRLLPLLLSRFRRPALAAAAIPIGSEGPPPPPPATPPPRSPPRSPRRSPWAAAGSPPSECESPLWLWPSESESPLWPPDPSRLPVERAAADFHAAAACAPPLVSHAGRRTPCPE